MASAASGDASPRDFMSFLLSRNIVPLLSGFIIGPVRSFFRKRSSGMAASFSQARISPHISARLLPHITGFFDLLPKLTPLILYRCSFSRSTMPAPRPPSSITTSAGLYVSMASITCPTTVMVSSPLWRLIATMSRPCRMAMTVLSDPNRAGSTPTMMGAVGSLCAWRRMASSTTLAPMNWSSDALGNCPYTSTWAWVLSGPYSSMICWYTCLSVCSTDRASTILVSQNSRLEWKHS